MESTLLIATYNRSERLKHSLPMLFKQIEKSCHEIEVILLDGSSDENEIEENKRLCQQYGLEYRFNPADQFRRMFWGLDFVKTKTLACLDDEDILLLDGYMKCVEFLEANDDYVRACGKKLVCHLSNHNNCIDVENVRPDVELESDDPIKRIWNGLYYKQGWHFRAVHKKTALLKLRDTCLNLFPEATGAYKSAFVFEYYLDTGSLILGKHKELDCDFNIIVTSNENPLSSVNKRNRIFHESAYNMSILDFFSEEKKLLLALWETTAYKNNEIDAVLDFMISYQILSDAMQFLHWGQSIEGFARKYNLDLKSQYYMNIDFDSNRRVYYKYGIDYKKIKKNSNVAIYGAGTLGEYIFNHIKEICCVTYFVDKNADKIKELCTKQVITPDCIQEGDFDYIILANDRHSEVIKKELLKSISANKILEMETPLRAKNYDEIVFFALNRKM